MPRNQLRLTSLALSKSYLRGRERVNVHTRFTGALAVWQHGPCAMLHFVLPVGGKASQNLGDSLRDHYMTDPCSHDHSTICNICHANA